MDRGRQESVSQIYKEKEGLLQRLNNKGLCSVHKDSKVQTTHYRTLNDVKKPEPAENKYANFGKTSTWGTADF